MTMAPLSFALSPDAADQTVQVPFQLMRGAGLGVGAYQRQWHSPALRMPIPTLNRFAAIIPPRKTLDDHGNEISITTFERSMSSAIITSWFAAMFGIGIFAYGVGWGGGATAVAGLLCLIPALTGVALARMIARQLKRPLAAIVQAAAKLSAGDRAVRVEAGKILPELADVIDASIAWRYRSTGRRRNGGCSSQG